MTQVIRLRFDFNGNQIGQPEIIDTLINDNDGLDKLARIYARMIKNDKGVMEQEEFQKAKGSRVELTALAIS